MRTRGPDLQTPHLATLPLPTPAANGLDRVLCVDLDGSLLATDLLHESALELIRTRPWEALRIPFWLVSGRARLKGELAGPASRAGSGRWGSPCGSSSGPRAGPGPTCGCSGPISGSRTSC